MIKSIIVIPFIILISACSTSRYQDANDSIPSRLPNQSELQDAIARAEPHSRGGNKNYQVRGINYQVLNSAKGFEQTGIASWYGKKFHGHLTSNGEIYDMYAMSAAHKNLPLPTYLKVTNLTNNKSVIVRVNDRGPFHQSRIVDLSYSAAYKLDMLKTGTAKVKITAITDFSTKEKIANTLPHTGQADKNYIQVFATSKHELAKNTANGLAKRYSQTVNYPKKDGIYRIQIGPIINATTLKNLLQELKQGDYPNAYLRSL
jgi:rare lipoprotein A